MDAQKIIDSGIYDALKLRFGKDHDLSQTIDKLKAYKK